MAKKDVGGTDNICIPVQEYVMFVEEANSEGYLPLITIFSIISVFSAIKNTECFR